MRINEFDNEYFEWMTRFVCGDGYPDRYDYQQLLKVLFDSEFVYILEMDSNRYEDGIDLRYRFGYENLYDGETIKKKLDVRPCSILEMMIALSLRCEDEIMADPDLGDRSGKWFWDMITSLNLESMDDDNFDILRVRSILRDFQLREYEPDGHGGLFTIENCKYDLRNIEIWYQMCWYLDTLNS